MDGLDTVLNVFKVNIIAVLSLRITKNRLGYFTTECFFRGDLFKDFCMKNWKAVLSAAYFKSDSDIAFYDSDVTSVSLGAGYVLTGSRRAVKSLAAIFHGRKIKNRLI